MPKNLIAQCDPDLFVVHQYTSLYQSVFAVEPA